MGLKNDLDVTVGAKLDTTECKHKLPASPGRNMEQAETKHMVIKFTMLQTTDKTDSQTQ